MGCVGHVGQCLTAVHQGEHGQLQSTACGTQIRGQGVVSDRSCCELGKHRNSTNREWGPRVHRGSGGASPGAREGAKYAKGCELLFLMYGSLIFDGRQFQDAHSADQQIDLQARVESQSASSTVPQRRTPSRTSRLRVRNPSLPCRQASKEFIKSSCFAIRCHWHLRRLRGRVALPKSSPSLRQRPRKTMLSHNLIHRLEYHLVLHVDDD
jgi:hypothetical protein